MNTPSPINQLVDQPKKSSNLKYIFPTIFASIILGGFLHLGFLYQAEHYLDQNLAPTEQILPDSIQIPEPNTQVQWNGNPTIASDVKLINGFRDDLNGVSSGSCDICGDIKYYMMGSRDNNTIILAVAPAMDPSGPALFFFEKTPDGKYTFMSKMSSYGLYTEESRYGYVLSADVISTDTTSYYYGILGPSVFAWNGLPFVQPYPYLSDLFKNYLAWVADDKEITIKKVATLSEGTLYSYERRIDEQLDPLKSAVSFNLHRYVLELPSGLYTFYYINNSFFDGDSVPDITWNNGSKNTIRYSQDAGLSGCGDPGVYVTSIKDIVADIMPAGTTGNGQTIYQFRDLHGTVPQFFFDHYALISGGIVYNYNGDEPGPLLFETWAQDHPIILYKNSLGEYEIFINANYDTGGGCGKPVIYLYPPSTMSISVKVGADVTVSKPLYNNGWRVLANPDGTLINSDQQKYDSLFWEGIGEGDYPSIVEGFVVRQDQLESALQDQLYQLGLNKKESSDFLEFWLPRMPKTPYVRLTWFTNKQLDQLAPLVIWPKPDTVNRIFLDFQGLENEISLPAQKLTSMPRQGFTVVEWGGLLRK